jgi:tRNA modification GTPase
MDDTIISLITAPIGGAISVIRVSGPQSIELVNTVFRGKSIESSPGNTIHYGKIYSGEKLLDEVLLSLFRKPNSYTGQNVVEISTHANPIIVKSIIELFVTMGCRVAEPGEFTKLAFLNGKIDLIKAEAIADIIAAKSRYALENSLQQIEGKLSNKIKDIKNKLVNLASTLELDIDFTEEGFGETDLGEVKKEAELIKKKLNEFIVGYKNSRPANSAINVLLIGKPNVGKSSLMNAITQKDRVIVSETPGTTRDVVYEDIIMDETIYRFIDTAGIHLTDNSIEATGVEKAQRMLSKAEIILLVIDISEPLDQNDFNLLQNCKTSLKEKTIVVLNKTDKQTNLSAKKEITKLNLTPINISATKTRNIEMLKKAITNKTKELFWGENENVIITNQRQFLAIENTINAIDALIGSIKNKLGNEFLAIDLRKTLDALSQVSGEITTEDVLNNIFSRFCVGK